jgi:uncharacterized protein
MQHLTIPFETKDAPSSSGEFAGYGAVFGNRDAVNDVITKGAFGSTLTKHGTVGTWPLMLFGHNATAPCGEWTELREDEKGLWCTGRLWIDGPHPDEHASKAYRMMKACGRTGLSIGYLPSEFDIDAKSGVRTLKSIDLHEISVVPWPCNDLARVANVKAAHHVTTLREFEAWLRETGGYSRAAAEAIAREGFKAWRIDDARDEPSTAAADGRPDPRDEDVAELLRALHARAASLPTVS